MKLSQKEIDFIYNNIDKLKEELANKYTTYTLQGKTVQLNTEQILLQSAKYLVDEEYSNSKQNSSIIANKEVLEEVGEILKDMSKNEYMQDVYLGLETQALFTVTPEQYKNPDYDTDNSKGLIDTSVETLSTIIPAAGTVVKAGVEVAPSVFNGGKRVIQKLDDIDNSIGSWVSIKKDNLPLPSSVKKWTTDNVKYDDFNDFYNPSMPASTTVGGSSAIIYDKAKEIINNLFNNEEKNNEEN